MNKMIEQVREFHQAFGHPIAPAPTVGDVELRLLRFDMQEEESSTELWHALGMPYRDAVEDDPAEAGEPDLVAIADALGDTLYVAIGTALALGIDLEAVFDEIHRSNMSKLEDGKPVPHPTVRGKAGKGRDYSPPNLAPILGL